MASSKERLRWERWYDDVHARMERQKASLHRLVLINTEAMAALEEIAGVIYIDDGGADAANRAQLALDRIKGSAAPAQVESVETIEEATPIEDPRRSHE